MNPVIEFCNTLSTTVIETLWRASWYGGLMLLAVWLIGRIRIKIPPRVMCWLWRLGFCKLWLASVGLAPVLIPLLPPQEIRAPAESPGPLQDSADLTSTERAKANSSIEPQSDQNSSFAVMSPAVWLSAAWCFGVALLMTRLIKSWIRVRQSIASYPITVDSMVRGRVEQLRRQMSISVRPHIRLTSGVSRPFLFGVFQPTIVLPSTLCDPNSADALEAALVHEMSHIKRHDLAWNWLLAISEIVFFFHPIVWLARNEWVLTQEIATDELTLATSKLGAVDYAKSMVQLLEQSPNAAYPQFTVAVSETYSQLNNRIRAMKAFPKLSRQSRFLFAAMFPFVALLTIVPWGLSHRVAQSAEEAEHSIVIRCVDESGKPISGVNVFQNHVLQREGAVRPDIKNKDYTTDADGKAKVVWMGESIDLRLWARKEKFVTMHAMWAKQLQSDGDQIPDEYTFTLPSGTEIGGIVKDETGAPIKGGKLTIVDQTAEDHATLRDAERLGYRPKRDYWLADQDTLVTDDQGRWRLNNVPRDEDFVWRDGEFATQSRFRFQIKHPDYIEVNYSDVDQISKDQDLSENKRRRGGLWGANNVVTLKSLRDRSAVFVLKKN